MIWISRIDGDFIFYLKINHDPQKDSLQFFE